MGLVTERLYDPSKPLYLSKNTRFDGRDYKKGDEAPTKDMSQRTLLKYFRTGLFVHEVRKHKSESYQAVEEPKQPVEAPSEAPSQDPVPETTSEEPSTTYTPKKRGRKPSKSKSE